MIGTSFITASISIAIALSLASGTVPSQLVSTVELEDDCDPSDEINGTIAVALKADEMSDSGSEVNDTSADSRAGWRGSRRRYRKPFRPPNSHNVPKSPSSPGSSSLPNSPNSTGVPSSLSASGSPTSCGSAPLNPLGGSKPTNVPYMLNGENQNYGEWPSYARLAMSYKGGSGAVCGGTLVSDQHILTAAHCVYDKGKGLATSVTVRLGDHSTRARDRHEKAYYSGSICVPDGYKKSNKVTWYDHDWTVITLKDRVAFTEHIQPACLPHDYKEGMQYKQCHLVGAGITGKGSGGGDPTFIQKQPVKQVSCASAIRAYVSTARSCYTKATGQGSVCTGDSGGPILCLDPDGKHWTLVALVSAGFCDKRDWTSFCSRITTLLPTIKAQCGI